MIRSLRMLFCFFTINCLLLVYLQSSSLGQPYTVGYVPGDVCFIARFSSADPIGDAIPGYLNDAHFASMPIWLEDRVLFDVSIIGQIQWKSIAKAVRDHSQYESGVLLILSSAEKQPNIFPFGDASTMILGFPYNKHNIAMEQLASDSAVYLDLARQHLCPLAVWKTHTRKHFRSLQIEVEIDFSMGTNKLRRCTLTEDVNATIIGESDFFSKYHMYEPIKGTIIAPDGTAAEEDFQIPIPAMVGFAPGDSFFGVDALSIDVRSFSNGTVLKYSGFDPKCIPKVHENDPIQFGKSLRLEGMSDRFVKIARESIRTIQLEYDPKDRRYSHPRMFVVSPGYDVEKYGLGFRHRDYLDNVKGVREGEIGLVSFAPYTQYLEVEELHRQWRHQMRLGPLNPLKVAISSKSGSEYLNDGDFELIVTGYYAAWAIHEKESFGKYHRITNTGREIVDKATRYR